MSTNNHVAHMNVYFLYTFIQKVFCKSCLFITEWKQYFDLYAAKQCSLNCKSNQHNICNKLFRTTSKIWLVKSFFVVNKAEFIKHFKMNYLLGCSMKYLVMPLFCLFYNYLLQWKEILHHAILNCNLFYIFFLLM